MTKIIAVVRHAQSAGKQSNGLDYDRILTRIGEAQARVLGNKLMQQNFFPDLILSSDAARARQTTELINLSLQLPPQNIQYKREFYEALMVQWLDYIHGIHEDAGSIMLVGHNPWLSMLAGNFAGRICELEPCELMAFQFEVDSWLKIDELGTVILNIK